MQLELESMRLKILWSAVLLLIACPTVGPAQTDISIRIRSLDVTFAGLLDDSLTDVYLNPARLARLRGSTVYAAVLPPEEPQIGLYLKAGSIFRGQFEEAYIEFPNTNSVGFGYFGVLTGHLGAVLGVEIGHDGSQTQDGSYRLDQWTDYARIGQSTYGRSDEYDHYVVDFALAPLGSGSAVGLRVNGEYDRFEDGAAAVNGRVEWSAVDPDNPTEVTERRIDVRRYERLAVTLSAGYFRPEGLVRDAVIGGSYLEESATSEFDNTSHASNDADGNGVGPGGTPIDYEYLEYVADSDRDYAGFGGFARAHFGWTDRLRSAHAASWTRSTGDGVSTDSRGDWDENSSLEEGIAYAEDGTIDRVQIMSSVGYHLSILDEVLVAFGVHGVFARTASDESASGEFSASQDGVVVLTSPYHQLREGTNELYRLTIPVAFEWPFHRYFTLRIGASFYALRSESTLRLSNNLSEALGGQYFPPDGEFELQDENRGSDATARYNTGLGFNFDDRVVVEMAYWNNYGVELARFYYLSARYCF